jgi:hypothetical protein
LQSAGTIKSLPTHPIKIVVLSSAANFIIKIVNHLLTHQMSTFKQSKLKLNRMFKKDGTKQFVTNVFPKSNQKVFRLAGILFKVQLK